MSLHLWAWHMWMWHTWHWSCECVFALLQSLIPRPYTLLFWAREQMRWTISHQYFTVHMYSLIFRLFCSLRREPGNEANANTSIHSSFIGYTHNWENCSFSKNWNVKPFWKTKIDSSSQTQTDYTSVQLDDGYGEECSTVPKGGQFTGYSQCQPIPTTNILTTTHQNTNSKRLGSLTLYHCDVTWCAHL